MVPPLPSASPQGENRFTAVPSAFSSRLRSMTGRGRMDLNDAVLSDGFAQAARAPTFFYSQKRLAKSPLITPFDDPLSKVPGKI